MQHSWKVTKISSQLLLQILINSFSLYFFYDFSNQQEAHVNTCYKHFYYFIAEFELVPNKELEPLKEMTSRVCHEEEQEQNWAILLNLIWTSDIMQLNMKGQNGKWDISCVILMGDIALTLLTLHILIIYR